jgi:hypothetical protein
MVKVPLSQTEHDADRVGVELDDMLRGNTGRQSSGMRANVASVVENRQSADSRVQDGANAGFNSAQATFQGVVDTLGYMYEARNANQYIMSALAQERERLNLLNAQSRTKVYGAQRLQVDMSQRQATMARHYFRASLVTLTVCAMIMTTAAYRNGAIGFFTYVVSMFVISVIFLAAWLLLSPRDKTRKGAIWKPPSLDDRKCERR